MPEVGLKGQERWAGASFVLAGDGEGYEAARIALERAGASFLKTWKLGLAEPPGLDQVEAWLVLTSDPARRRHCSRRARSARVPAVFGWALGDGFALARFTHQTGCACLECFESNNLKAFLRPDPSWESVVGAQAASEMLLGLLNPSPSDNQVWLTYVGAGTSLKHPVEASAFCPANREG